MVKSLIVLVVAILSTPVSYMVTGSTDVLACTLLGALVLGVLGAVLLLEDV